MGGKREAAKGMNKKRKQGFTGRTRAHRRFLNNIHRTRLLLQAGLTGLSVEVEKIDGLIAKFHDARGIPGPPPKDYEPEVEVERIENGGFKMKLDARSAYFAKKMMEHSRMVQRSLRFHFYSMLAVYIWGTFETYLLMLFEELFTQRPEMLISDETVRFRDIIEHRDDPIGCIIENQIEKIGHFSLDMMLAYLKDKINFQFSSAEKIALEDLYLVRNIVAHNTGLIRRDVRGRLPDTITLRGNEIRVTMGFLKGALDTVERAELRIEKHVVSKFLKEMA